MEGLRFEAQVILFSLVLSNLIVHIHVRCAIFELYDFAIEGRVDFIELRGRGDEVVL